EVHDLDAELDALQADDANAAKAACAADATTTAHAMSTTTTADKRAQARAEHAERLQHATRELLSSNGWQRSVKVGATSGLTKYTLPTLSGSVRYRAHT